MRAEGWIHMRILRLEKGLVLPATADFPYLATALLFRRHGVEGLRTGERAGEAW